MAGVLFMASMPVAMAAVVDASVAQLAGSVTAGGWTENFDFPNTGTVVDEGGGTFSYTGSRNVTNNWDFDWSLQANADPFIAGMLNFTNTTANTQTFNVLLSLPIQQLTGLVDETGEVGLTLTDTGGGDNSATLTVNQWHGLINPFPPQLDMPLLIGSVFNCDGGSNPGCATTLFPPAASTQQHGQGAHGGLPIDSIGIHLNFDLSAGDTVSFNTRYELVSAVPVPAAAPLFVAGLIGLAGVARRKKRVTGT